MNIINKKNLLNKNADYVVSMENIYECFSDLNYKENFKGKEIVNIYKDYISLILKNGFNEENNFISYKIAKIKIDIPENKNKVLVLFSGGKDSIALALKLKEEGKEVHLFHITGLNISFKDELITAKKVADYLGLDLIIKEINIIGHCDFLENPCKNQLAIVYAIQYGIEHGFTEYAIGDFKNDILATSNIDRNYSDAYDLIQIFVEGIRKIFPNFNLNIIFNNYVETLTYIGKNKELCSLFQSCITPLRYRGYLSKLNSKKYNINLRDKECGSCWKCCTQYIVFMDKGYIEFNKEFYKHCLEVLNKKFVEEKPHLLKPKDLKDVYRGFIGDIENSIYFRE